MGMHSACCYIFQIALVMVNAILGFNITLCAKIEHEDHSDRNENDSWRPRVLCPAACHTDASLWSGFELVSRSASNGAIR